MDRMIYLTMSGAKAMMQRQESLANNLANVSTTGFRAELQAFRAVPVRGDGASTRVYALETTIGHSDAPGVITQTGRPLDVAMQGNAWLAVQALDGTEAYTRNGAMTVGPDGMLMTHGGLLVLGDGGPIQVPENAGVSIAPDGTVSARGQDGQIVPLGRLKLVTPEQPLQRGTDGLFRTAQGEELPADPNARVVDGALEGSNVSAVETMVSMIAAARQFEAQMKMLQTAERNEQTAGRLLSNSAS
ncbi:flagellar basal-body rod protein FlgF [Caldimonas thermodepolymerans]|jgi:flagellar basal-body rod protein FlgF|uniref:Flagellar basal-body rod protein FlgF n=1 Tax=Caldimonas thermodepolymerans TaxID=215580 RepID=A0A2S5T9S5_9BURK|nr:flagellar basal-body rod protein FlgF [Caldimonas thermodepolymerans]PPE71733.1 flagellar basal-body rod protein FlgF [Caldimonas thermodepolymerans]QPC30759.1 flagellar basal-body rod protein FlgF [Caldimonas thermodepolymerans]RDI02621.1 flagellar basal-body rod protein FlgF [Caldimonas thermodepolymerans]TCP08851.1 flagellar basal-body rod protein FlgF [Caldimonas thermodepolymerans]UZG43501.1 flagellar basal-body rod protein FlgF [Caldimonas thermodepolymerans]